MTEFILPAILNLFEPLNILLMIAGLAGGIIIGALPGLSATMGVALMVPATFAMNPTSGLIMLGAIYGWGHLWRRELGHSHLHAGHAFLRGDHVRRLAAVPEG